jgi:signal transduction histidine kinase
LSLHRALTIFVITFAALAVGAGISLILLTTYLHQATIELEEGLHAVRLAEEIQIDLLTYIHTADESQRARIESDLQRKLRWAAEYGGTLEEDQSLLEAEQLLDRYFAGARKAKNPNEDTLRGAFAALRKFVDVNVQQANAPLMKSEHLDKLGDQIGITVAITLGIGMTVMLVWLHRVAFRPVFEIRDAMKSFAAGQKEARAAIHGPEEFKSIAAQFNEMAEALARQHRNQTAFLAGIAHDLRNPISALKVSADIISGRSMTAEKLASLMAVIKRQVNSLDRMVADLLESAKIESGHLDLRFEESDAGTIARDAFELFRSASEVHQFVLNLPDEPLPLRCDPVRIGQVLHNLLSNAIKYSPGGGKVILTLETRNNEVLFHVSDRGKGISQEDLRYVFEPFRRIQTAKEDIPGVGLGLSVAQRIVWAHGGRIQVDSEIMKGTTFTVHLPIPPARQACA